MSVIVSSHLNYTPIYTESQVHESVGIFLDLDQFLEFYLKWYYAEERRIMDKYTKFILTMIAVALFGINYHLFSGDIISSAKASHGGDVHKIAICSESGNQCGRIANSGEFIIWDNTGRIRKK